MNLYRRLFYILLLAAAGILIGKVFNSSMGISISPRKTMPAHPDLLTRAPAGLDSVTIPWVMFDQGGVGIDPDTAAWKAGDYDHELRRFTGMYVSPPVYIDTSRFTEIRSMWHTYLNWVKETGGTAIEFKMMLEFIDFSLLGDGHEVYPEGDSMLNRQEIYRTYFGTLFQDADSMGLDLILSTDMVALTPELETYLRSQPAGLDTGDPAFWEAYQAGIEELFMHFPFADGIQVRVGEAGSFYNRPNWPYRSEFWV